MLSSKGIRYRLDKLSYAFLNITLKCPELHDVQLTGAGTAMLARSDQLQAFRSDYLNLIILPTEACNFRCTYCYETFENKKMSRRVVTGIKSLIDRRGAELNELEISWFGGEPLLAFDVVTDICKHAIGAAKAGGFNFSSNMTTNGYFLDRQCFLSCLANGIGSFQISLDGGPNDHNTSRKLASGAGTFDRIWANLLAMKEVPGEFTILLRTPLHLRELHVRWTVCAAYW